MADSSMADMLAEANNDFGLRLHLKLAEEGKNVFFSPISISMALSMLFRGAKGETADELKRVLGFEKIRLLNEQIHQGFQELFNMFMENQQSYTLAVANAVVSQKDFPVFPDYKSDLKELYRALLMEVDFVTESASAVKEINDWVAENTNGKISNLFDSLDPSTVMILLNAVYFKGTWQSQFDPANTYDGMFYNNGVEHQAKHVPLMYMEKKLLFVQKDTYKALELPYNGNDVAMLLLLPNEMSGLKDLENALNPQFVTAIRGELREKKVEVTLPKLHLEYYKELVPILKALGISQVFQCGANLKGICDSDKLRVSDVIHKAVLDVNEEGSEAAAVTAVVIMLCSMSFNPVFKADHPFLFVIYHKRSNLILFMGRVESL